ncbi:MAG TPA: ABC transporter ATP-binding protein [Acidimicrobiia bacterium]|nr:ABC transporter ATP-binding protein [Acidimicrobiia bacterium]
MLSIRDVSVRYGTTTAVDHVDLHLAASETLAILGPSGSGKSTLLRAVAGLEPLAHGSISWRGNDLAGTPPHERRFGLMFQDYALFPHHDVGRNVEFGLRMADVPAARRRARVREVLDVVGLAGFERRPVAQLSGGEQQRVALARALAPDPRLLMLDEPLGALDRALREHLVDELRELLDVADVPAIYVTHDHDEAFTVADRVAVMHAGRVVQVDAPAALWRRPIDPRVAQFLGFGPTVDAIARDGAVRTPWGVVPCGAPTGPVIVVLRPGAFAVRDGGPVTGVVRSHRFAGERVVLTVDAAGAPAVDVAVAPTAAPPDGTPIALALDPDAVLVYPRDS